jgi:hypothetical protein
MLDTLKKLKSEKVNIDETVSNLLDTDKFDVEFDRRVCLAIAGLGADPDKIKPGSPFDDIVVIADVEYLVTCDDGEANQYTHDRIVSQAASLEPAFLSAQTDFDESVFTALADSGPDANEAVLTLVAGRRGLPVFIKDTIADKGRAHFLGEETEVQYGDERTGRIYRRGSNG